MLLLLRKFVGLDLFSKFQYGLENVGIKHFNIFQKATRRIPSDECLVVFIIAKIIISYMTVTLCKGRIMHSYV